MRDRDELAVKITSVSEEQGRVLVKGTAAGLGTRCVEITVNGDILQRCAVTPAADGTWQCVLQLAWGGEYEIEASVRDYADFSRTRMTTPDENYFFLEEANVWGATVAKHSDGLYYMIFSMWETHDCFKEDWHRYSELGLAVSTRLGGPYVYMGKALDANYTNTTNEKPVSWPAGPLNVFHNPSLMYSERDQKYYLYFMGTTTEGEAKSSHLQRVGVAVADSPVGPWRVSEAPVIDVREHWEWSLTANPSVTEVKRADGSYFYYAVYKASGTYDGQRLKATGYATAPTPEGPFSQSDAPIMRDPEVGFSVEDCYVWRWNGRYYALAKDMTKGHFSGVTGAYSYALFVCEDGVNWQLSEHRLAFKNEIPWERGTATVSHLERAQLYIEQGVPRLICNATTLDGVSPYRGGHPCNVQIPLCGVPLVTDTCAVTVTDLPSRCVDKTALVASVATGEGVLADETSPERRKALQTALRAARILLHRDSTEQRDVDFVAARLRALCGE